MRDDSGRERSLGLRASAVIFAALSLQAPLAWAEGGALPLRGPLPVEPTQPLTAEEIPDALAAFDHAAAMQQRVGAEFLSHYQRFIAGLQKSPGPASSRTDAQCAALPMWGPFVDARRTYSDYTAQSRRTKAAVRELQAYAQSGYGEALTPDLRKGVDEAVTTWARLADQHRTLAALLDHQMTGEVERLGCDPSLDAAATHRAVADARGGDDSPTLPAAVQVAISAPQPPPAPPPEPPQAGWGQALAAPLPPSPLFSGGPPMIPLPDAQGSPLLTLPLAATFVVDNLSCGRVLEVWVDGEEVGDVPGYTRSAFVTVEGPHTVCVGTRQGECQQGIGEVGMTLYEGSTVKPGC